jgi:hypothetical protein
MNTEAFEQSLCFNHSTKVACTFVPMSRERGIAANASNAWLGEKGRVIACPQAKRSLSVSSIGGALIKKPSGYDISPLHQLVTVRKK